MTPLASPVVMMAKHDKKIEEHNDSDNTNVVSILKRKFGSDSSGSGTTTNNIENNTKDVTSGIKLTSMQLAATAAAFALAFAPLNNADAAMSGGRMGGSFSSPRPSMSRSAPRSSSSSYGRGYSRGYSSGYVSRPMIGYGGGYGYGGGGVISRGPSVFDLLFVGGFIFSVSQIFLRSSTTDEWSSSSVDTLERGWSSSSALGSGSE